MCQIHILSQLQMSGFKKKIKSVFILIREQTLKITTISLNYYYYNCDYNYCLIFYELNFTNLPVRFGAITSELYQLQVVPGVTCLHVCCTSHSFSTEEEGEVFLETSFFSSAFLFSS